jgi:hypothetical protein
MIRNPKAFEVWSTCSLSIHYVIMELGMLPFIKPLSIKKILILRVNTMPICPKGLQKLSIRPYPHEKFQ